MINFWLSKWAADLITYTIAAVVVLLMCVAVCIVAHIQKKKIKDRNIRTRDMSFRHPSTVAQNRLLDFTVSDIDADNIQVSENYINDIKEETKND